jgi:hypothetical protein
MVFSKFNRLVKGQIYKKPGSSTRIGVSWVSCNIFMGRSCHPLPPGGFDCQRAMGNLRPPIPRHVPSWLSGQTWVLYVVSNVICVFRETIYNEQVWMRACKYMDINHSTNQPSNQPTNQSINQSISHYHTCVCTLTYNPHIDIDIHR